MSKLSIEVESKDAFEVREFSVFEKMSSLFDVSLTLVSPDPDVAFDAVVGRPARFAIEHGGGVRFWSGICDEMELVDVDDDGLSTYRLSLSPVLWLATQRRDYRVFQHLSEVDIALSVLEKWKVEPAVRLERAGFRKRQYRVQYGESDYFFFRRMLEEAGVAFYFEQDGDETRLVLSDAPQHNPLRGAPLPHFSDTSTARGEYVTGVRTGQKVRPGRYVMRDHDDRHAAHYKLAAQAKAAGLPVEDKLVRYHYTPGAFLFDAEGGGDTPVADGRGKVRSDEAHGAELARKRLDAKRSGGRSVSFDTNALDVAPGSVVSFLDHPRGDLSEEDHLLVIESSLAGSVNEDWTLHCEARRADHAYRPPLVTAKPEALGLETCTVTGPPGEEIHCDELGRVHVHFHWDPEHKLDDTSSCWLYVSQPWSGPGYGVVQIPRVGTEALVAFLGGDPDHPVIVGRVHTYLDKAPYKLPEEKTKSGIRTQSLGQTGGYSELTFDDVQGKELVRLRAERDLITLVQRDQEMTVGKNLTKTVQGAEREITGASKTVVVGVNRSVRVGMKDELCVGTASSVIESGKLVMSSGRASIAIDGDRIIFNAGRVTVNGKDVEASDMGSGGDGKQAVSAAGPAPAGDG